MLKDGPRGSKYKIIADLGISGDQLERIRDINPSGKISEKNPLSNIMDFRKETFTVFYTEEKKGPTPEKPIQLEFSLNTYSMKEPVLQIIPRPNYGPREIELFVRKNEDWVSLSKTPMESDPVCLQVPKGKKWRLTIPSSYDRLNRNVQIAELKISDGAPIPGPKVPNPLKSVSVECIGK